MCLSGSSYISEYVDQLISNYETFSSENNTDMTNKVNKVFQLQEDKQDFDLANKGKNWLDVCWEMDQWLRKQYKYMSDEELSQGKYDTYVKCREQLKQFMLDNNVDFDEVE